MREKLIELLKEDTCPGLSYEDCAYCKYDGEHDCFYKSQADHLIANGVTIQKWIPVTERLPQEDGRYMCNVKSFAFPGSFYQTILKYDKYGFREGHIYTDDVTHWMYMPEPPKGE